ncbi:uncharacterized protein DSM5745_10617 [Aspergillus mulundensis]|uniref:Uncharacterized protein n=1 Tax=Aspergillus mulundensis TaxID=1810919 RepID=A0A3D8QH64_9EURO|nr:hypothetical protein DSM5745_10617 [Aspergillus mulundensis]RDW61119.1 hypothetical protein DSM5745_10617 [Aspergillus mulundensis]
MSSINTINSVGEPVLGSKLAAHVASAFDSAGVPYCLWGYHGLGFIHLDREDVWEVEFVIPDAKISLATAALKANNLVPCTDSECGELNSDQAKKNPPEY